MTDLEVLIKKKPVYLHMWTQKVDVICDFCDIPQYSPYPASVETLYEWKCKLEDAIDRWRPINILFASYGLDYSYGDAFVLLERDWKLYEVNASHSSCDGLEGQFQPEETTVEALQFRLSEGTLGKDRYSGNCFSDELKKFLSTQ